MDINKSKFIKIFQIITAILYAIATVLSVIIMVDILSQPQNIGTAFAVAIWIVFAAVALSIPLVFSIIGLIASIIKKSNAQCGTGAVVYFIIFSVLPILTYLIGILVFNLLL